MHDVQSHGTSVILNLFRKAICQPGKTAHPHTHGQVLTLNKRSADVLRIGSPADSRCPASNARCWTVAALREAVWHAVNLYQHRVINISTKGIFHGINVNSVTIGSELDA